MLILQKILPPYPIVPTIPLLVALVFQIGGILLILNSWQVKSKLEQVVAGSIMLTFPVLAYAYAFSTINSGIGIGFFCVALSLFIYTKNDGPFRLLAVIPAVFALGIYQAFFLVMAATYSVYLILEIQKGHKLLRNASAMISIHVMSFAIYYLIQKIWQSIANIEENAYITSKYMDLAALGNNTRGVLSAFRSSVVGYYFGDIRIYGIEIRSLEVILVIFLLGLIIRLAHERISNSAKALVLFGTVALLGVPFSFVLLSRGVAESRTLLALPTAVAGLIFLGLLREPKFIRALMIAVALFTVFKFSVSNNRLFSSSYLVLQADRLTAVRLMEGIDNAKLKAGVLKPEYLEVVGILTRPPTDAIFRKTYPFGDSFFEFTFDISRITAFLQISGYDTLKALPWTERYKLVNIAAIMPAWPADGSVRIVNGNVVMVKFGEYSDEQRNQICSASPESAMSSMMATGFCP
jgi:hypothetical protein